MLCKEHYKVNYVVSQFGLILRSAAPSMLRDATLLSMRARGVSKESQTETLPGIGCHSPTNEPIRPTAQAFSP